MNTSSATLLPLGTASGAPESALIDRFGRRLSYLRVSVTDKCDLRCSYCMPKGFHGFEEPENWLNFDEIQRVVAVFARLGVARVRLTGGEPLLRRGLPDLVQRLSQLPGLDDISLSSNATQLAKHAQALRHAGLKRINVSLDSLDKACTERSQGVIAFPVLWRACKQVKVPGLHLLN